MEIVHPDLPRREGHGPALLLAPQSYGREETRSGSERLPPPLSKLLGRDGRREDLELAGPLRNAFEELDSPAAAAARDAHGAQRRLGLSAGRAQEDRKREPDVADPLLAVESHQQRGVIEVRLDPAEREAGCEPQAGEKRVKRRHAREAGPSGAGVQMIGPEEPRPARFFGRVRDLRAAHDLGGGLEGDALVEPRKESLEIAQAWFGNRQIERLEDVFGRDHRSPVILRSVSDEESALSGCRGRSFASLRMTGKTNSSSRSFSR